MEAVHTHGIWLAECLQRGPLGVPGGYGGLWQTLTHMGDPKAAVLLLFPLAYTVDRRTGVAVAWTAALSEWLNLVFKWMLFGERPFWWIRESGLYLQNPPEVQQFASTCETGPGSPSGHAMVTAAVWWVVVFNTAAFLHRRTRSLLLSSLPYAFYAVMLVTVGLSRVFILAHFPHQVLAGSVTGWVLGVVLSRSVPEGRPLLFFACTSVSLLVSALSLHAGLTAVGVDLSWSISLARRWCSRSEWIRMDTAPFSSLARACGTLLGLGLGQSWAPPGGWRLSRAPRALSLALASLALYHLGRLALPARPPARPLLRPVPAQVPDGARGGDGAGARPGAHAHRQEGAPPHEGGLKPDYCTVTLLYCTVMYCTVL